MQFHIITGMAPVPLAVQVTQIEAILKSQLYSRQSPGDFSGDKGFSPYGRFMVEEDAVTGEHAVGFPVIDRNPIGIELGDGVGRTGIERRFFILGRLLNQTVKLGSGCLVELCLFLKSQDSDGFKQSQSTKTVCIGCVFRAFKGYLHVALGRKVVNFVGLDQLYNAYEIGGIG